MLLVSDRSDDEADAEAGSTDRREDGDDDSRVDDDEDDDENEHYVKEFENGESCQLLVICLPRIN